MDTLEYNEDFLRSIDVHTLLPQQDPFVMIGTMTHFEMKSSTTETQIGSADVFVRDGHLSPAGMIENIAQTCAARIGFYNRYILHKDVQTGFIGAVKNFIINGLPAVNSTIVTKVDVVEEIFGMTLARAVISCNGNVIAEGEIKLSVRNA